jgi:hypothetical protein
MTSSSSLKRNLYNYSNYNSYSMASTNSSIQLSKETKALISTFGTKEDTYEDIILRMYKLAAKEHVRQFLMSSENTITLEEARRRHLQRWPKSK